MKAVPSFIYDAINVLSNHNLRGYSMDYEMLQALRFISYLLMWATFILAFVAGSIKNPSVVYILIAIISATNGGISYAIGDKFLAGLLFGGAFAWIAIARLKKS